MALLYNGELRKLDNEDKLNLGLIPTMSKSSLANMKADSVSIGGGVDLGGGIKNKVTDKGVNVLPITEIDNLRSQNQTDLATGNAVSLESDLSKNGIKEPLVITYYPNEGKAVLTDGHNRLDVAKDMGAEKLPIRIVEKYTDAPNNAKDWTPPKAVEQSLKEGSVGVDYSPSEMNITEKQFNSITNAGESRVGFYNLKEGQTFPEELPKGWRISDTGSGWFVLYDQFGLPKITGSLDEIVDGFNKEFPIGTALMNNPTALDVYLNINKFTASQLVDILEQLDPESEWRDEYNRLQRIDDRKADIELIEAMRKWLSNYINDSLSSGYDDDLEIVIENDYQGDKDKLAQAEKELKDAWDNYKKLGAIFDAVESAKKDLALIRAIVNYAIQKGLKTIDEITDMVKQSLPNAKQLKDDVVKRIELASEIVSGTRKYSDVLLEKYVANNLITQSSVGAMQKIASDNTENGILDIDKAMQAVDSLRVPKSIKEACREYLNEVKAEEQAPQQEPVAEPKKKVKQEVLDKIFDVLTKRISSVNMPDFITADLNGTAKQQTSITTGEVEGREIPNEYVQVTLKNLQEVAESDSASFMQEFGEDWIDIVLQAIEMSASNGRGYPNYARVIGVLNAMSTQINQSMATNTTKAGKDKLDNLQARVDAQANIFARESSLGLRMRLILRVFAEGSSIANILANKIISSSIAEAKSDVEQAVKKRYSDAELNNANRPVAPKKTSQATAQSQKETNDKNDVLDSIKAKIEVREKTNGKMPLKDRIQQLQDKLKNLKCS